MRADSGRRDASVAPPVDTRSRRQLALLAAPQYRNRAPHHQGRRLRDGSRPATRTARIIGCAAVQKLGAPTIKLDGFEMGPVPGHADSAHHWLRRSTGSGHPGHQAPGPRDGSHPGHADSSQHWRRRSTGIRAPTLKLPALVMGPIPATRTARIIGCTAVQKSGPPPSSSTASRWVPSRPRGQLASLAAPQYRVRAPGHQARAASDGSHPATRTVRIIGCAAVHEAGPG